MALVLSVVLSDELLSLIDRHYIPNSEYPDDSTVGFIRGCIELGLDVAADETFNPNRGEDNDRSHQMNVIGLEVKEIFRSQPR